MPVGALLCQGATDMVAAACLHISSYIGTETRVVAHDVCVFSLG